MGDQKQALRQLGVKDFNPETELPKPRPRCYGNFGTIICHKDRGGMCGPYAEPCEVYTSLIPSKFDTCERGRSKVRDSKRARGFTTIALEVEMPEWLFSKYPIACTLCGGSFEHEGKRVIFPYPMKHYLCFSCFMESLDEGLGRLNERLATGDLDISVEEIADLVKPRGTEGPP